MGFKDFFKLYFNSIGSLRWWRFELLPKLLGTWGAFWIPFGQLTSKPAQEIEVLQAAQGGLAVLWWITFFSTIPVSFYRARRKLCFSYCVKGRDIRLTIKVGNSFDILKKASSDYALVVPINNQFHVTLGSRVKGSGSMQDQLINKFFAGKPDHLRQDIEKELKSEKYQDYLLSQDEITYKFGTAIHLEQQEKKFYLLANSRIINADLAVESKPEDIDETLFVFWRFLSEYGKKDKLILPLLGTGNAKIGLSREQVTKKIITSFLRSLQDRDFCQNLEIILFSKDVVDNEIDLESLDEFLRFSCTHYGDY